MHYRIGRIGICLLLALALLAAAGVAETMHRQIENPDIQMEVTVGYEGSMTYGRAMPVCVRIENNGADLRGTVAVNIYNTRQSYDRYEVELTLAGGAAKELRIPVTVYSRQELYTVELVQDGEVVCAVSAAAEQLVNPNAMLVGTLSPDPQSLSYMNIAMDTDELLRGEYMQLVPLTQETFPEEPALLNSFGAIVVDGFDVAALSDAQRESLGRWLEGGRILIVGGGAQAGVVWPGLNEWTGLEPGDVAQSGDISGALLSWLGIVGDPMGQGALLAAGSGGETLIADGETPLVWRARVGEGAVYTAAFELGARPVSAWPAMHTFWQRLLIQDNPQLYQSAFHENETNYNNLPYLASSIPMENRSGMGTMIAATAAFLLAAGLGAYFILRRADKRQYLWAVLPAIAVLCAAAICAAASMSPSRQPVALSVSALRQDEDGVQSYTNAVAVATADRGEHLVTAEDALLAPNADSYYYDDYDDKERTEPTKLNYRYLFGERSGLGVRFDRAWEVQTLLLQDGAAPEGSVETAIWREEDGMHGYVVNHTGMRLSEGVIISRFGYCSVPALAPEERCEFTLVSAEFADPQKPEYEDGCMYEVLAGGYADIYSMIQEYFYQYSHLPEGADIPYDPAKGLQAELMMNVLDADYQKANGYYSAMFHYVAFSDEFPQTALFMDGRVIDQRYSRGVVSAAMKLSAVGNTGVVYHPPGMDQAVRCEIDAEGRPYLDPSRAVTTASYHRLQENPVFAFDLSDLGDVELSRMILYSETYRRSVRLCLYDGEEWIEQGLSVEIEDPERFIGEDGMLYVQFRADAMADDYTEVYTPTMLLEGRVK